MSPKTHRAAVVVAALFSMMTAFIILGSNRIVSSTDCRPLENGSHACPSIEQGGAIPGSQKTEHQVNPNVQSPVAELTSTLSLPEPNVTAEFFHPRPSNPLPQGVSREHPRPPWFDAL